VADSTGAATGPNLPAPRRIGQKGVHLWHLTQRQLREQRTWEDQDAPLLERYVRAILTAAAARALIEQEGFTVAGSRGQPRIHPALDVAERNEDRAQKFATALLLTPEMRKRHGIEPEPPDELGDALG
jgi:P27 family predicted phage terminase small subunit